MRKYTTSDLGCYIDSFRGLLNTRKRLANMLENESGPEELITRLRGKSDDDSEIDEAIDWLNTNACTYPAAFAMVYGDLVLINVETERE